ncbi:MAG: Glu-tRNA(Gln) amidotransferase subunit GatE [Candidatus Kapaibacterium sp.]
MNKGQVMYDFKIKPFEEMTPEDYARIGFKSGLEVHQQLLTEKKLFCRCPAGHYNNHKHNAEILRHMRPTLSELGEYDGTALMEFKTKKDIIYRINYETVCTYEMDDTPPFEINQEALDIALQIGMLFDATLVDELHIARKQYLDGSIPTGFQRTAITCIGGKIPFKDRHINLIQMSIEEDSCREVADIGHSRYYITDRLGMPLIETVTHPEMKTPQEVAEVNEILRRLVRSTGKVRTGIGAARQDVNVSVEGGTRIEIKGVPRIPYIPLLTYNEAKRQWNLLRLREELKSRGISSDNFDATSHEVTKALKKTRFQPIAQALEDGRVVKCVNLKGFKDLLTWETQTDTYFSKEISDRVRVIACLTTLPNIIHSDSPSETILSSEWKNIKRLVGAGSDDTIVLVWGSEEDTAMAASEIIIRAKEATIGIPSETRQALRDGTNGFERILPGPERMYPDTDLPPKKISDERMEHLRAGLPEPFWKREKWYKELEIPEDTIRDLAISVYAPVFDQAVKERNIDPKLAAVTLMQLTKRIKKTHLATGDITPETMDDIFEAFTKGLIPKEGLYNVMLTCSMAGEFREEFLPGQVSESELKARTNEAIAELDKTKIKFPEMYDKILMGTIMNSLRGRINGGAVKEYLKEKLKKEAINV